MAADDLDALRVVVETLDHVHGRRDKVGRRDGNKACEQCSQDASTDGQIKALTLSVHTHVKREVTCLAAELVL